MRVLLRADWVVDHDLNVHRDGVIVIENGKVKEIREGAPEGDFDEEIFIKGCIYPPVVNAHCHLELSELSFNPELIGSFFDWLIWVIGSRQKLSISDVRKGMVKGIDESKEFGTAIFGDISSFGVSKDFIKDGVSFSEVIGKEVSLDLFDRPLSVHSIYSVSASLIRKIAEDALEKGYKFQMHLGEVIDEQRFVRGERNRFEELIYPLLKRDRYDRIYADSVVDYLEKIGAFNENLIAVHCTNLSREELDLLMEKGCGIVLCPRSNVHLKVGFPDFEFLSGYENLAIGTDGLSSNVSLSIFAELRTIYYRLGGKVSLRELLRIATVGGLKVLSLDYRDVPLFTACYLEKDVEDPFLPVLMDGVTLRVVDLRGKK